MKKTLVSALTTALVVGAASTTFAASNPFSDVPADHWAYDAVSQLAADGVIEGYGDNTFKGNRNITRYEMAQMVAKAMTKNTSGADKAMLDKLAAEFAEELNNLGVRVSNLEKNADMVKWTGEARYRYWSYRDEQADGSKAKTNTDQLQLRLFPTAEVNEHWKVKGRLTGSMNMDKDNTGDMKMTFVYADGDYKNFNVKLGKMPLYSANDEGLVMDDFFSGAQVTAGKDLKVVLEAGRWNAGADANGYVNANPYVKDTPAYNARKAQVDDAASYQAVQLNYAKGKVSGGVGYRHFDSEIFKTNNYSKHADVDDANIWSVGGKYAFNKNIALLGSYAQNTKADYYKKSGNVELDYKGANKANKGSWGAYVAYRHLGANVSLAPTYDTAHVAHLNEKGWDFGASYIPMKNVLTTVSYFNGKQFDNHDKKAETLYARVSYFF
ncbi:putative major envelope protein [Selenomonas ruminantium subsp. lactilytica TAM6421]|uniref:Putative major envelope protein n=1 Tax=Selenomonas ruminantium subsp. lactilytica (strain NBRC 103574 / TAM6421) TaxID=927704 RepID=I0GM93_SELRL|nr:S-layer homology domain-containing protein [Selenomonas ruminantium]BAL81880.1 putative major envelope protein [Selenomonas ruminantium subsp. lactilytica TAM6421]